jgi:glyoxylase I family protein
MFKIVRLDHIVLRVHDLDAMLRFYRGALGCTLEREQKELGLYQLRAGDALIDLVTLDGKIGRSRGAGPGPQGRNLDHFCLRIEPFDLDALRRHFADCGVAIGETGLRYGAEGEGLSVYISDPEGNVVELKGPPAAGSRG